MSLVGDIIMGCREQMTDLPSALGSPFSINVSQQTAGTSGPILFAAGTIVRYAVTQLNPWGESAPVLGTVTVAANNSWLNIAGGCSYSATSVRVYFASLAGAPLEQYFETIVSSAGTFVVTIGGTASGIGVPPVRSSAWLPDSDGTAASAATMYRWLNDGLEFFGSAAGGIRDVTGIPTTVGQAQYSLVGLWKKIDNNFHDGYPVEQGTKQQIFRHSNVTGLSGTVTTNMLADRQMVEFWPQPQRTAGNGVLNGAITASANAFTWIPGPSGFVLGFGLILIGTYPPTKSQAQIGAGSCELIYYSSINATTVSQIQRGMGGTQPQAWANGTPMYEVNSYMTGLRFPVKYAIGQASLTLSLPPTWVDGIRSYMLYRFRDAEQNRQEAQSLLKECQAKATELMNQHQLTGPRSIQIGGAGGVEIASGFGSPFGGIILR